MREAAAERGGNIHVHILKVQIMDFHPKDQARIWSEKLALTVLHMPSLPDSGRQKTRTDLSFHTWSENWLWNWQGQFPDWLCQFSALFLFHTVLRDRSVLWSTQVLNWQSQFPAPPLLLLLLLLRFTLSVSSLITIDSQVSHPLLKSRLILNLTCRDRSCGGRTVIRWEQLG